jgi:tetratricopeptide (TPR) repeat protein
MFGWFQARCPLGDEDRLWIEARMAWLIGQFGAERMLQAPVILPTEEFFPDPYDGSEEAARALFPRVCRYMGIDPGRVQLDFYCELDPVSKYVPIVRLTESTGGLYNAEQEGTTIWIEARSRVEPSILVGVMAHELGHVHLLGDGRISAEQVDHEPLTDLLTVYMGLGLFTANSAGGYLTFPLYGYALALFAWCRREFQPAWARHLRLDVRVAFRNSLRWLTRTGGPSQALDQAFPAAPPSARKLDLSPKYDDHDEQALEQQFDEDGFGEIETGSDEADACFARGLVHAGRGDHPQAIEEFSDALRHAPNDAEAYQHRSLAYRQLGRHQEALADAEEAVRLDDEDIENYRARGLAHFSLGHYEGALADFDRVLDEEPEDAAAWYWRGLTWAAIGDYHQATRDFNRAIRYVPTVADYYIARSQAYEQLGQLERAVADRAEATRRGD